MDKAKIKKLILEKLEADLAMIINAAKDAHATATHDETAAKSKYDTFALEASYLAHGQSLRAQEITASIEAYQILTLANFKSGDIIDISALVTLENDNGDGKLIFVGPQAGGIKVSLKDKTITVVTPEAPLGKSLMGATTGDCVNIGPKNKAVEFEITKIM